MNQLALAGGTPIRSQWLPYGRQSISDDDVASVCSALRSPWLTTGPKVAEFEAAFAERTGARFAVAVSSGTAALHAAASGARIRAGDEVIVPALTFAATANCVRYQGGTVVFADVRDDTLNLDPNVIESLITARTRAIITVDYAGQPSDMDEVRSIAVRHDLQLIEDASHSLGATYDGVCVGTLASMTTFSLHPVKLLTTGEGGVVTTDDQDLADHVRRFRNHGITTDHRQREEAESWHYEMIDLGYNYRLTDFQCALGLTQLFQMEHSLRRRREIARHYDGAFAELPELKPVTVLPDRESAFHLYPVRLDLKRLSADRKTVFRALRAENIGVNVHYIPVPWHPYYMSLGYQRGQWPVAEAAYERLLSLPMFAQMDGRDVQDVIDACFKVLSAFRR